MKKILPFIFMLASCGHYVDGYDGYTKAQLERMDQDIIRYYNKTPVNDGTVFGYNFTKLSNRQYLNQSGFINVISDHKSVDVYEKKNISDGILKTSMIVIKNNKPITLYVAFETLNKGDIPDGFIDAINNLIANNYGVEPIVGTKIKLMTKSDYKYKYIKNRPSKSDYINYKSGISNIIESISYSYDKSKSRYDFNKVVYRIDFVGFAMQQQKYLSAQERSRVDFIGS
ncbi:hypothetical protein ACTMMZ_22150 [Escherichia coli]|uniref:hypothetical protein n=1 Tax=Escherichia coli TaxID=562 RepID=UPI003F8914A9